MGRGREYEDEGEDVDDIVDPLAGLRNNDDDDRALDGPAPAPEPAQDAPFARPVNEGSAPSGDWDDDDALDLGAVAQEAGDEPADELLLGDETDEAPPAPEHDAAEEADAGAPRGRRRGLVSGEEGAEKKPAPPLPQSGGGGTLFERMAKLSRSGAPDDEDDDEDDDGSSLNIPRFLGRQNNQ